MMRPPHPPLSTRDVCRILFRHRRKSQAFFAIFLTAALVGILLMPRRYVSEARFLVKPNLRVDPTASGDGSSAPFDPEREAELRSVVTLLQSRVLCERVADELGVEVVLETDLTASKLPRWLSFRWPVLNSGPHDPAQRERAVQHLLRTIRVDHPRKTHVVVVSYASRSAKRAQQVLSAFVQTGLQQHLEISQNPSAYRFFEEQERLLASQVLQAKHELSRAKNLVGWVSVESQKKVLEGHLLTLDRQLLETEIELAATRDRISALQTQLPADLRHPRATSTLSVRSLDEMRNQLFTLELRYREASSRYRERHPVVQAVRAQVADAELALNQQQLLHEMSAARSLQSRQEALHDNGEATRAKLRELHAEEVRIAELERRVDEATANHRICVNKLEQARLDQQLGTDQISNLRVAQAPTQTSKPVSRRGGLILCLACVVGLLGAVGLAYVAELLDESLSSPADVESGLGLPVLLCLPRLSTEQLALN